MSYSEQAEYSAEYEDEAKIVAALESEKQAAGSVGAYLNELYERYLAMGDHRPNMLQLRRMAVMMMNATNDAGVSLKAIDAFYAGEILGYHVQELLQNERWPAEAYLLFNNYMRTQYVDKSTIPPLEHAQLTTDLRFGRLETMENPKLLPRELNEMVEVWVAHDVKDVSEQMYLTLGFRHVTVEALEVVKNAHKEAKRAEKLKKKNAQDKKLAQTAFDDFIELMDRSKIDDITGRETELVDDVISDILCSYADHREAFGEIDSDDQLAVRQGVLFLERGMQQDFLYANELQPGDMVRFKGEVTALIINEQLETRDMTFAYDDQIIQGVVESVGVQKVPTLETIARYRDFQADESLRDAPVEPMFDRLNPVGPVLIVTHPVLYTGQTEDKAVSLGYDNRAAIILNTPGLAIDRLKLHDR